MSDDRLREFDDIDRPQRAARDDVCEEHLFDVIDLLLWVL